MRYRLLAALRILFSKKYHLMTCNKKFIDGQYGYLIKHINSAYGKIDNEWLDICSQRIDPVIDQWEDEEVSEQAETNLNFIKNQLTINK